MTSNTTYHDIELKAWGNIFCQYHLHKRLQITFFQFMALSADAKHERIQACLNRGATQ